jgi:hypothetical protein
MTAPFSGAAETSEPDGGARKHRNHDRSHIWILVGILPIRKWHLPRQASSFSFSVPQDQRFRCRFPETHPRQHRPPPLGCFDAIPRTTQLSSRLCKETGRRHALFLFGQAVRQIVSLDPSEQAPSFERASYFRDPSRCYQSMLVPTHRLHDGLIEGGILYAVVRSTCASILRRTAC